MMLGNAIAAASLALQMKDEQETPGGRGKKVKVKNLKRPQKKWVRPSGSEASGGTKATSVSTATRGTMSMREACNIVKNDEQSILSVSSHSRVSSSSDGTSIPTSLADSDFATGVLGTLDNSNHDFEKDVTLLGKSGVEVKASKSVIGDQNYFLQKKLDECDDPNRVYIGEYDAEVFELLNEFCLTGTVNKFVVRSYTSARILVELADLAVSYNFGPLYEIVETKVRILIESAPQLLVALYDASSRRLPTHRLRGFCFDFIRQHIPETILKANGLRFLSVHHLELFLTELQTTEVLTFSILYRWVQYHGRFPENMEVAQCCCSYLSLSPLLMNDPRLRQRVRESGFFDLMEVDEFIMEKEQELNKQPPHTPTIPPGLTFREDGVFEGICYQLTPKGLVIACSVEGTAFMPNFCKPPERQ